MECIEVNWSCKHMKKARSGQAAIDINSITTLWRKPPYQRTVRKLRANKRIYCSFLANWAFFILMFLNYICEIFWLASSHLFLNLAYYQLLFKNLFLGNIFNWSIVEGKIWKWLIKTKRFCYFLSLSPTIVLWCLFEK